MGSFLSRSVSRRILLAALMVLVWQLTFPSHTQAASAALETKKPPTPTVLAHLDSPDMTVYRLPQLPDKPQPAARREMRVEVTAYSSTPDQTSGDPFITASGTRVHHGTLAANFLPIGTKVRFPDHYGNTIFTVEDRMHPRYNHRADIWMETREEAKQWGIRHVRIEILED